MILAQKNTNAVYSKNTLVKLKSDLNYNTEKKKEAKAKWKVNI
ncbi:hypothetical protein [Holzapfeliella sp. JNUCC 80]